MRLVPGDVQNLVVKIQISFNALGQYEVKVRAIGTTVQENTVSIYVEKAEP
ncbi:MAG: hypothetical protein ACUVQ0_03255 [Thermoproteota archaeon]